MGDFTYRFPPCPYYDTPTMENWLEEMAAKGLVLGTEGIFPGIVAFEKSAPRKIRYRLIASAHAYSKGRAYRYAPVPDEKTQNFYREFGWQYIATRRDFHIYACTDPSAPEMDTDPQVQAMAFAHAARRQLWDLLCYSLIVLMYLGMFLWEGYQFLLGSSHRLHISHFWICIMWIFYLIPTLHSYRKLRRLEKLLRQGEPLPQSPGYRKTAPGYWLRIAGTALLISALLFTLFGTPLLIYRDENWVPLSEYTGDIPFATMKDLLPGAQFREDAAWDSHILVTSTPLAEIYQLEQQLHITLPDGTETSGKLEVIRRETAAAHDQAVRAYERGIRADYEPVMLTLEGIDYAFYYNDYSFDYVVLQKGDTFLSVNFHIYEGDPIRPEEIAGIMASYLRE